MAIVVGLLAIEAQMGSKLVDGRRGLAGFVAVTLALLASCTQPQDDEDLYSIQDSAGIRVITITAPPAGMPERSLMTPPVSRLDGNAPPHFERITSGGWLDDGRIVVLDRQADQLHLFSEAGEFIRSFGRSGDGPGEFANIATVTVAAGDSIIVLDRRHNRISVFHPDNGFVRDLSIRSDSAGDFPNDIWAISPDRLALLVYHEDLSWMETYDGKPFVAQSSISIRMIDGGGAMRAGPVRYAGGKFAQFSFGSGGLPLSPDPAVAAAAGRVVAGLGEIWELHILDEALALTTVLRWPGNLEPITDADRAEVVEVTRKAMAPLGAERLQQILDITFSPEAVSNYRPAHGRIIVGSDGSIWVARHEPYKPETLWYSFQPNGQPIGTLQLPDQARLLAATESAVMYVLPDSLDVQSVYVSRLARH
jgi:hypothetical protein